MNDGQAGRNGAMSVRTGGNEPARVRSSRTAAWTTALAICVLTMGCVAADEALSSPPQATTDPSAAGAPDAEPDQHLPPVAVLEGDLVAVDIEGQRIEVAALDAPDTEAIHASVRPGTDERLTVLVLTRVTDGPARYELRYATVDLRAAAGATVTDLYWFPWRSQVDEHSAAVLDVPPMPLWAPDGSALAWIEWTDEGTRLRTVGWYDDGVADNPSDEVTAHRLRDVPPGTQLERWLDADEAYDAVLIARGDDDARYRIEVVGDPA